MKSFLYNVNILFLLNLHTPMEGHVCNYLQQRADVLRVPDSNPILGLFFQKISALNAAVSFQNATAQLE